MGKDFGGKYFRANNLVINAAQLERNF